MQRKSTSKTKSKEIEILNLHISCDLQSLPALGKFRCNLSHNGQHSQQSVFVVDRLESNLLGLPAITALHLAVRTDALQLKSEGDVIQKKFQRVFQRLGTGEGEYHTKIRTDRCKAARNPYTKTYSLSPMIQSCRIAGQNGEGKVFSKLNANSAFWQIPLSQQSHLLTTFITPKGRYCFNTLPLGISSASEHFQRRMSKILAGLEGVLCQMDKALIFGKE